MPKQRTALFAGTASGSATPALPAIRVDAPWATFPVKRMLGGLAVAIAMSAQALAADMPVKALPPVPVFYDWSGVYVGVHAGYGGGMKDWPGTSGIGFVSDFVARGAFGGGQIGINKQLGSAVFGLELDGSWTNLNGSQSLVLGSPAFGVLANQLTSSKIDGLVTFAGRAGLAADRWFVFAKGGLAVAHENHANSASIINFPGGTTALTFSGSEYRVAPMLGFGTEYALGNNWSVKAEYDYVYLGSRNVDFSGTITAPGVSLQVPVIGSSIQQAIHLAKLGVNYRFGGVATDPSFAPVRAVAGHDWSGAYIGAEGAYGFGHNRWPNIFNRNIPDDSGKFDIKGGLGGATVGANAQSGVFVFGVEGDWMWSGIKGSQVIPVTGFNAPGAWLVESKVNWLATATARAGFVVADKLLVYGKGGVAIADERHSFSETVSNPTGSAALSGNAVHTGLVAGAGAEYALGDNWSIKAEYDYVKMLDQTFIVAGTATGGGIPGTIPFFQQILKLSQDIQLVKFGLNYRFNPAPIAVSARY